MKIEVVGSGCATCKKLFEIVQKAVSELKMNVTVEYTTDIQKIVAMGLMQSPVLLINNKPVLVGFTSDLEKIKSLVNQNNTVDDIKPEVKPKCNCSDNC